MKSTFRISAALIAVAASPPLSAQRLPVAHGDTPSSFPILADPLPVTGTHPDFGQLQGGNYSSSVGTNSGTLFFTTRASRYRYPAPIAADVERGKAMYPLYSICRPVWE
jgi:hypothetical protein